MGEKVVNKTFQYFYHDPGKDEKYAVLGGGQCKAGEIEWCKGVPFGENQHGFNKWWYMNLTKPNTYEWMPKRDGVSDAILTKTDHDKRKKITHISLKNTPNWHNSKRTVDSQFLHLVVLKKDIENFVGDTTVDEYDDPPNGPNLINRFFPVLKKKFYSENQISDFQFEVSPRSYVTSRSVGPLYDPTVTELISNWITTESYTLDRLNFYLSSDEDLYLFFKMDFNPKWSSDKLTVNYEDYAYGVFSLNYGHIDTVIRYSTT